MEWGNQGWLRGGRRCGLAPDRGHIWKDLPGSGSQHELRFRNGTRQGVLRGGGCSQETPKPGPGSLGKRGALWILVAGVCRGQ